MQTLGRTFSDSNTDKSMADSFGFDPVLIDNYGTVKAEINYTDLEASDAVIKPQSSIDGDVWEDIINPISEDNEVLSYSLTTGSDSNRLDIRLSGFVPGEYFRIYYDAGSASSDEAGVISGIRYKA